MSEKHWTEERAESIGQSCVRVGWESTGTGIALWLDDDGDHWVSSRYTDDDVVVCVDELRAMVAALDSTRAGKGE